MESGIVFQTSLSDSAAVLGLVWPKPLPNKHSPMLFIEIIQVDKSSGVCFHELCSEENSVGPHSHIKSYVV
jgi:hypothetical protein